MAKDVSATNLAEVKSCKACGCEIRKSPSITWAQWRKQATCSYSCANAVRADHTPETLMKRFWAKIDKSPGFGPNGDCWHWTARRDGRGYGEIKVAGRYKKAHRIALFSVDGMNDPRFACHRCDNPQCVRPDHLFPGEAVDNVRDMIAKGRRFSSTKTQAG